MTARAIDIVPAHGAERVGTVRELFEEYAAQLGIDLCFQGFAEELAGLPGAYGPPQGGVWLARCDGKLAGCVALRLLEPGVAELKRLYVRDAFRGLGLGRKLTEVALGFARRAGYRAVRLDTLPGMRAAQALYRSLGFRPIPEYAPHPVPGTVWMELALDQQDKQA